MILRYELSKAADADLEGIYDYTLENYNLNQAYLYVTEFEELFLKLVRNPKLGRERSEILFGLRSLPKDVHIVFYRILKDHIRIVRVLHGSRDLPRNFK